MTHLYKALWKYNKVFTGSCMLRNLRVRGQCWVGSQRIAESGWNTCNRYRRASISPAWSWNSCTVYRYYIVPITTRLQKLVSRSEKQVLALLPPPLNAGVYKTVNQWVVAVRPIVVYRIGAYAPNTRYRGYRTREHTGNTPIYPLTTHMLIARIARILSVAFSCRGCCFFSWLNALAQYKQRKVHVLRNRIDYFCGWYTCV